jgi:hypothetical protein
VSYSFFGLIFLLAQLVQKELCLFYNEKLDPLGFYLLWAAGEPKRNECWILWENRFVEIHWRQCSRKVYSSETRAFIILPRPMNPVVSPCGSTSVLSANRGPSSLSSLLRKPLVQSGLAIQRLIIEHPGFCLHSPLICLPLFGHFTACCQEGRKQRKLKELSHEPAIVATTKQTWWMIGLKRR